MTEASSSVPPDAQTAEQALPPPDLCEQMEHARSPSSQGQLSGSLAADSAAQTDPSPPAPSPPCAGTREDPNSQVPATPDRTREGRAEHEQQQPDHEPNAIPQAQPPIRTSADGPDGSTSPARSQADHNVAQAVSEVAMPTSPANRRQHLTPQAGLRVSQDVDP